MEETWLGLDEVPAKAPDEVRDEIGREEKNIEHRNWSRGDGGSSRSGVRRGIRDEISG